MKDWLWGQLRGNDRQSQLMTDLLGDILLIRGHDVETDNHDDRFLCPMSGENRHRCSQWLTTSSAVSKSTTDSVRMTRSSAFHWLPSGSLSASSLGHQTERDVCSLKVFLPEESLTEERACRPYLISVRKKEWTTSSSIRTLDKTS